MKSILLSIRPEWVVKIINDEKTIEVRKRFPIDFVGWVYIYCCKQRKKKISCYINYEKVDGKVVARFWCDKVEEYSIDNTCPRYKDNYYYADCCLTNKEIYDYVGNKTYKAIHISKLEIFDKPKELDEFQGTCNKSCEANRLNICRIKPNCNRPLKKAPQNYCYVEI